MSGTGAVNFAVTAVDNTANLFDKIEKRIKKVNAPVERLGKSFGNLAKTSGLTGLVSKTKELGDHAEKLVRGLGQVLEPLGIITGAASIAGMIRLTTAWANWGSQLLFTSQNIDTTATKLQAMQGAAMLAGSSSASLSSGLQTLGQNMWDAIGGRAPQVVAAFQMLHINWQNANHTARSTMDVLPQIADRISALKDPYAQAAVATALFGGAGQDLLPFLRLGSKGIAQYNAMAVKYGVISQAGAEAANKLRMSQVGLTLAAQGLCNSIAEKLQPVLGPMIDHLSDWIANNRVLIATDIAKWVTGFYNWVVALAPKIQAVIDKFGGWQDAATDLAKFMGGVWLARMLTPFASISLRLASIIASIVGLPALAGVAAVASVAALAPLVQQWTQAPTASGSYVAQGGRQLFVPTTGSIPENGPGHYIQQGARRIWVAGGPSAQAQVRDQQIADFQSFGWSNQHAAAIVGNAQAESSFNPGAYSFDPKSGPHYGLFQWSEARRQQILAATGIDVAKAGTQDQDRAAQWELTHTQRAAAAMLHAAATAQAGGMAFDNAFEVSGDSYAAQLSRGANAAYINSLSLPSGDPVNIGGGGGATVSGLGDHQGIGTTITVAVEHKNAPPDTRVSVTSNNPAVKTGSVKVERAMLAEW